MKRTCTAIMTVILFAFLIALLFTVLQITINDRDYITEEYLAIDHAPSMGMSNEDLVSSTLRMIDYMECRVDSIDLDVTVNGEVVSMFNEQERLHMADVQQLYQGWILFRNIALIATAAGIVLTLCLCRKQTLSVICRALLWASLILLILFLVLGIWVMTDFNSFWTEFHHLFFTNDLWMFDPSTSRMINMMPERLFFDITVQFALRFLIPWIVLVIAAAFGKHFLQKKERRR